MDAYEQNYGPASDEIERRRQYFGGLGFNYWTFAPGEDAKPHHDQRVGQVVQKMTGAYRGVELAAYGEQRVFHPRYFTRDDKITKDKVRIRNHLKVSVHITPVPQAGVIQRVDRFTLNMYRQPVRNGQVVETTAMPTRDIDELDKFTFGPDLLRSRYVLADQVLDTGVPQFEERFALVSVDDQAAVRTLFTPELCAWIAADPRSPAARIFFSTDGHVQLCFMTEMVPPPPPELFTPDRIFPAADYLIDLLEHAPARIARKELA